MAYCSKCSAPANTGARFCASCGAAISAEESVERGSSTKGRGVYKLIANRPKSGGMLAFGGLFTGLFAGVFFAIATAIFCGVRGAIAGLGIGIALGGYGIIAVLRKSKARNEVVRGAVIGKIAATVLALTGCVFLFMAPFADKASGNPSQSSTTQRDSETGQQHSVDPNYVDTKAIRAQFAKAVKSACGWNAVPEVAGYYVGMSLGEAEKQGGASLKCEASKPITSGNSMDAINDIYLAPNSSLDSNGNAPRAAARCETTVDGNDIYLWFFPRTDNGPVFLGEAINTLDSPSQFNANEPVAKALSEKYGVDIDDTEQTCSEPTGIDADFAMDVSVTQPLCKVTLSPDSAPTSGCIIMQDNALMSKGGAIIAQRDARAIKTADDAETQKARQAANANRY